jgi:hypothetical protein
MYSVDDRSGPGVPFLPLDYNWDAYLREKISFVRANPRFGAQLTIIWENGNSTPQTQRKY